MNNRFFRIGRLWHVRRQYLHTLFILSFGSLSFGVWRHFQQYLNYIMATTFSVGRSRREPPTMGKQLVNLITWGCESSHFCNLQSRPRTHAVLVINLYELLGNPTTLLIEPPGLHLYPLEEADSPIHVVTLYPHYLLFVILISSWWITLT